jgi:glycosyltransferase involved in cell wall biosynthesis
MNSKPTPVCFTLLSTQMAGVENVVLQVIKHINRDEVTPYLVVSEEIMELYQPLLPADHIFVVKGLFRTIRNPRLARWYRLADRRWGWKINRIKKHANQVGSWLSERGIQVVHTHLLEDHLLVAEIKKHQPINVLLTVHGTLGLDPEDGYETWLGVEKTLEVLRAADHLTSACQFFIDLLQLHGFEPSQFTLVPNGCEIHDDSLIRNEERITPGQIVFLGGGRNHQKGGTLLLKALKILKNKGVQFHLHIAGEVPQHAEERQWVSRFHLEEHVTFTGFIPPPRHLELMASSELFVLPSHYEGVANSLLEALSLGMKIVATKVGGSAELLHSYPAGKLCHRNASELAEAIELQLQSPNTLSLEARYQYNWSTISTNYATIYFSIGKA